MRSRTVLAGAVAIIGSVWLCAMATASPVKLGRLEFQTETAGLSVVVDSLGALEDGVYPTAIPMANGVYSAACPWVYSADGSTRVLTDGVDPASPRTFSGFRPGTRYWATDLGVDPDAVLRVTAIGVNDTVAFDVSGAELGSFLAIGDRSGLVAVSVAPVDGGAGNIVFANIATAVVERGRDITASAVAISVNAETRPAPESSAEEPSEPPAAEPPTKAAESASDYVSQRAVATLVASREAPEATGSIEARSDAARVSLAVRVGGVTEPAYELRVNGVKVAELAPTASGTAALTLATDDASTGAVQRPLDFDPFGSRYEIVRDGAVILQTTLGGVAVGGELVAIR